jgi:hypothetical protein
MDTEASKEAVALLRHTIATIAYRGGKALRGAPPEFAGFRVADSSRTPLQILAHVNDLFDWAESIVEGAQRWQDSTPQSWDAEVARFFAGLERFDARLASGEAVKERPERLFQGPIADALTHIGQIAMLRRIAGAPMRGENYFKADIAVGRVGATQNPPKREFD